MNSFYWSLFFFSERKLRFVYQKWRWRWIKWYEGRRVENHDPMVVMFCCPWSVVDLCISSIWNVLSLSKIVGATFSKLDWQCRYVIFRICGRLKTPRLQIKTETKLRTWKHFTANCYFEFAGQRFKNGGWICWCNRCHSEVLWCANSINIGFIRRCCSKNFAWKYKKFVLCCFV